MGFFLSTTLHFHIFMYYLLFADVREIKRKQETWIMDNNMLTCVVGV